MAVLLDDRAHATAIKAALDVELDPKAKSYDYGTVPGDKNAATPVLRNAGVPNEYAVVTVEQEPTPFGLRMSAQNGVTRWIVSVGCVGRTVDEARWVMFQAKTALHQKPLLVAGEWTEPLQPQTGQAPEYDDGRYRGLLVFGYSH